MTLMIFRDRTAAGQYLAGQLHHFAHRADVILLALPRGGVLVAAEMSRQLNLALDLCIVRKLGVPGQEELAFGAIAGNGTQVMNAHTIERFQITKAQQNQVIAREMAELARREQVYRGQRSPPILCDRTVILVDDGIATGATMRAAIGIVQQQRPTQIIIAVPVAAQQTCDELQHDVDHIICPTQTNRLLSIGHWYDNFQQISDQTVKALLAAAW